MEEAEGEVTIVRPDDERGINLLGMSTRRAIFFLAWPSILAGLLENIATTVDFIMVGRLGAVAVAAVGFSGQIYWVVSSLMISVGVATTALVARHVGSGEPHRASNILGQAIPLGILVSLILSAIGIVFARDIFVAFGTEESVVVPAAAYLRIICTATVFLCIMFICSAALRGAGDTRTPMLIGLVTNVVHIVLNYLLIFGKLGLPALGVKGAAIGSAISYLVGAVIYLRLMLNGRLAIRLAFADIRLDIETIRRIMKVSIPAAVEQMVIQIGMLTYVKFIVDFGTIALSAYQVGMRVWSLSFIPNFGFSTAASTLVGQHLGAQDKRRAKESGWESCKWALLALSAMAVLFLVAARPLASLFVNDEEVVALAATFIRIIALVQFGMAVNFTLAGALRGAGDTRWPMYIVMVGMYGFRLPGAYFFGTVLGYGLIFTWSAILLDYCVRVGLITWRYASGKWLETRV